MLGDPQRRDVLRAAGRLRAAQFDWATVARRIVAVYQSVTPGGEKVVADLSGHFWGRMPIRRASSTDRPTGTDHTTDSDTDLAPSTDRAGERP